VRGWTLNFVAATRSLREQWQRAVLSALGVLVGCTAIVLLVSIASGVQQDVRGQVEELGVNVLVVIPGRIEDGMFNPNLGGMSYLKPEDAKTLREVEGVRDAVPFTFVGGGVRSGEKTATSFIVATEPGWFQMRTTKLREGRLFRADEREVCVIGSVAAEELFGTASAIGRPVSINGRQVRVIGVTEDRKSEQSLFSMGGLQNLVYLPFRELQERTPELQVDRIMVHIETDAEPKALIAAMDSRLAQRLDRQQFQVLTQEDLLGLVFKLMGILTWLLTGLTSIALFVGGVGIMAVMLMSVNERAKEIGIRKTTGATRADIFRQFLYESTLIALSGGVLGLGLSAGVCELLRRYTPIKPLIEPWIVAMAFGVCIGVGVIFGLIPAIHAARKDPIAALRSE